MKKNKKISRTPILLIALFNFLIIILLLIYIIYLRFIPYATIQYDGYAVNGKKITQNLLNTTFNVDQSVKALKVNDQDGIYQNLNSYYLGASKQDNINLNYPIYVNDALAIYNLSSKVTLITDNFSEMQGYSGFTLTSGGLYNTATLERADYYDYILMKNEDGLYINTKEIKIKTVLNEYKIPINSIVNITNSFITYYTLEEDEFIYNKIIDLDYNSTVIIEDYNKEYTYLEFLTGLKIYKEKNTTQKDENNTIENEITGNTITNKIENTIADVNVEEPIEEEPEEEPGEEINTPDDETNSDETSSGETVKKWIKPTVECTDFIANVYTATTQVSITDPSKVIYKAVTFAFYKDDKLAFRSSATSSGEVKITKLLPNTTYKVIGTYQYTNKEGSLLENTFVEQEITTKGVEILNKIELGFENGQIYSNKIELTNFRIASDIKDEAVYGVSKAEMIINGTTYTISSSILRNILKGEAITYQSQEGLKSNTKCEYEIKFYDTAGNEMELKNYKGSTVTSKKAPSVKITVSTQEVIKVTAKLQLINDDNLEIKNYRYILYSSTGEIVKQDKLSVDETVIEFTDLNLESIYIMKIYADYNIEDGNGTRRDQEIGSATFSTVALNQLGSLKIVVTYNADTDITSNSINLGIGINAAKTDARLISILKEVKLQIQDSNRVVIKEVNFTDISALTVEDGVKSLIENLNSNTTYNIVITATVKQGTVEQNVNTSYTVTKFTTNKADATLNIKNVIITTNLIDMDIYIDDKDGACSSDIATIRLTNSFNNEYLPTTMQATDSNDTTTIKSNTQIPTNKWIRLTYTGLTENETYTLSCEIASYNITNENNKVQNNYLLGKVNFTTTGLGGSVDLIGMERKMISTESNLIDVTSVNNWYSQCFNVLETEYTTGDTNSAEFNIVSKYNYGKTYSETENTLTLLSNQCYVYDFSNYIGQTITISFSAKVSNANAKVYIQKGKSIGKNITQIESLTSNGWTSYEQTLTVPSDGYVGFYLEKYIQTDITPEKRDEDGNLISEEIRTQTEKDYNLEVKNLKVELGDKATAYTKYQYDLIAKVDINFIDKNHVTYNEEDKTCKYYIKITSSKDEVIEYEYDYNSTENIEKMEQYALENASQQVDYTIELIIKQNGREYVLDTVKFTYNPDNKQEIKSISTVKEFLTIQPYGNYILLNDLDLTNAETTSQYTFGSPNISFYGSIDFNGKTIKKDTYSLERKKETTSYLFYKLETTASLENVVIDFYVNNKGNRYTVHVGDTDNFIADEDGIYSLFLYNNGSIDNVIINLKQSTQKQRIKVGLMGYRNAGTIENFIINFEDKLYGSQYMAGVCLYSTGVIQNGYLYGQGIEGIGDIVSGDYRYIAGVVLQLEASGVIQNVYNISTITLNHCDSTYSYAANIVYNLGYPPVKNAYSGDITQTNSTAQIKNVYSVMPIITVYEGEEYYAEFDADNAEVYLGPNIINKYTNTKVSESYYFCDVGYEITDYNIKASTTGLYEPGVQDVMLNANGYIQFEIDNLVTNGYYPHLYLNYCMPEQANIRITITGNEIIDVLSGAVVENIEELDLSDKVKREIETYIKEHNDIDYDDENVQIVQFRVYNPAGTTISKIQMQYLSCDIMSQSYSKKVSTVYTIVSDPTSYLDAYYVELVQSRQANGRTKETKYGEKEEMGTRTINATFIKKISTAEEWYNINDEDGNGISGLIQNYRLISDIDFENSEYSPYITGTFTGYIDGEYNGQIHTLKNIKGSQALIENISEGTIKNLYIDTFVIDTSSNYVGLIGYTEVEDDVTIDNINITDMTIYSSCESYPRIGGILASANCYTEYDERTVTIQNCSIQGLTIELTNSSSTYVEIGGISGFSKTWGKTKTYITNCYVQNLNINGYVNSYVGVGGIIGYVEREGAEIKFCYTTGKINANNNAGGIMGYGSASISYCYSTVSINSKAESGNARIGGIAGYSSLSASNYKNNLFAGSLYTTGNGLSDFSRIVGNLDTSKYNNYAYKYQLISGEVSTQLMGATALLSDEEMFAENTYNNLLKFDSSNYAYVVKDSEGQDTSLLTINCFPKLNDTYGNLLPNQKNTTLDNAIKLVTIKSTPNEDGTKVTVEMQFEIAKTTDGTDNTNSITFTNVKIENDDMQVIGKLDSYMDEKAKLMVVKFEAIPKKAYESYKIETIYYTKNGISGLEKEINTKIKVTLYKAISSAKDWNDFFAEAKDGVEAGDGRKYTGQNIKITGDIDFSEVDYIESNVIVGRFEADSKMKILNVTLDGIGANSGLLKEVKTSFKNIDFENVTITGKGHYIGLVSILRGQMSNCTFEKITIDCNGNYDYIGVISRCIAGSFNNVTLNHVTVTGRNYVGGICGQTTSLGRSANIKGTYIKITGNSRVGGLFGYANGTISDIEAYQNEEDTELTEKLQESGYLVSGKDYVGGLIGYSDVAVSRAKNTNSVIKGTGNYVGGNIGYTNGSTKDEITSTKNIISGTNYVGGNIGYNYNNGQNITSTDNTITGTGKCVGGNIGEITYSASNLTATNNKINGVGYVGGCIGNQTHYKGEITNVILTGSKQEITGTGNYVGGVIGKAEGRLKELKAENCRITADGNYVGGIVGSSGYSTDGVSSTSNTYYSIAGAYAYNVTVTASGNYVGGISGYAVGSIYSGIVENCEITTSGERAGGIVGHYTGYSGSSSSAISSSNYFLVHSYVYNSSVQANKYAGGIVGYFVYGNIQYCYVGDTNIKATGTVAGGIVGYFDNSKLSNIQYKATIKYNYIANTQDNKVVSAGSSAGGLIGVVAKKLNYDEDITSYSNVECNMVVTDVIATLGNYVDMVIGSVDGGMYGITQSQYMNNIYVYECSTLTSPKLNGVQVGGIIEQAESYQMLSNEDLATTSTFTKYEVTTYEVPIQKEQEDDSDEVEEDEEEEVEVEIITVKTGLNFGTKRYDYKKGYFPILKTKYENAESYWGELYWNEEQNKIAVPNREKNFTEPTISMYTSDIALTSLETSALGMQVMSMRSLARMASVTLEVEEETLPEAYVYAVDIDKINIEFSDITSSAKFVVTSKDGVIVEKQNITSQVYTLNYDFTTPLQITVSNASYWYTQDINKQNTQNLLSIVDDEYFYILNDNLYSNKRKFDGTIVNIYENKALDASGNIYNITTMNTLTNGPIKVKLLNNAVPIVEAKYKDTTIQTFYHCSKVIQNNSETYKNQQMIVKDGLLYVIDGTLETKGNSLIIDSYNSKQYETILGEDGVIYDLLSKLKYPSGFKNSNIVAMTNNISKKNNVVLVYYSNGRVYGFNYITGEEVYDNAVKESVSFVDYVISNLSSEGALYETNNKDYLDAQTLTQKLEKVSIEEAIENIDDASQDNEKIISDKQISNNDADSNNNIENAYITAYDPATQKYVVYNEKELLSTTSATTSTENEKINQSSELISYYDNVSTSKQASDNIGIMIISVIVLTIFSSLFIMYKKNNR